MADQWLAPEPSSAHRRELHVRRQEPVGVYSAYSGSEPSSKAFRWAVTEVLLELRFGAMILNIERDVGKVLVEVAYSPFADLSEVNSSTEPGTRK